MGSERGKVWVSTYLPHEEGSGVERFVYQISEVLRAKGFSVEVLHAHTDGLVSPMLRKFRPWVAWRIGRSINKRSDKSDLILCNGYFSWNARRERSLVVYHGTEIGRATHMLTSTGPTKKILVRTVGSWLDRRAGRGRTVVAVSQAVAGEIERCYGHRVDHVIPNAVDLSLFSPRPARESIREGFGLPIDKLLVLFVGPPDPRKGLRILTESVGPNLGVDTHLVLRTSVDEAPRNSTVIGRLSIEDLARLYSACDALVLPSDYEGCSITLAEALASGLPAITSNVGSAMDLVKHPILGRFVVSSHDPKEYLERISLLASNENLRCEASAAARDFAERFHSPEGFAKHYLEAVERLTG